MRSLILIARREFLAYVTQPVAYVFVIAFTVLAAGLAFHAGRLLERGEADLLVFFQFHPWLYLVLMPAIGMRLWAEEYRGGTVELLLTLPLTIGAAVVGKFLAAWAFAAVALALTFPVWVTVNLLGAPDNGVIFAGYLGSWLVAGGFLAVTAAASALTGNQVIAFILAAAMCFLLLAGGTDLVQATIKSWAGPELAETLTNLSALARFRGIVDGLIDLRAVVFFTSLIGAGLVATTAIVHWRTGA